MAHFKYCLVLLSSVFYSFSRTVSTESLFTEEQFEYLDSIRIKYRQEIDELKKEVDVLKRECKAPEEFENSFNKEKSKQKRLLMDGGEPVAFYAHISGNTNVNYNQAIRYDVVKTNVGNGYNSVTGEFKAPIAGVYHFTNTVMSQPQHGIHVDIVQNGHSVGKNWADHNGYESGSVSVIVELDMGDIVLVRDSDGGSEHLEHDYNSFSGFLITAA